MMRIISWTGEYTVQRSDIRGDLHYRYLYDGEERLKADRPELFALFANVKRYPGKFDKVTSVIMSAGLTISEVELEIKLTSLKYASSYPSETVDYRQVKFWGEKHIGLVPGETIYDALSRMHNTEAGVEFGITFR